jgi:DNA-binding XRE family transcriptional regulator
VDSLAVDIKDSLGEAVGYMFKPTPETELRAIVAQNLRAHRALRGISQEDLATLAGVHRTYVSQIERELKNVSIDSLRKLANALHVDVHVLLTR